MQSRVLIVDGHSMIFAWPDLAAEHTRNARRARSQLLRSLRDLQDSSDWTVVVVFDGAGKRTTPSDEGEGVQVFYSSANRTADSIIERLVAKYAQTYHVTVATNDHMERTTVMSFGASAISSDTLLEEIRSAGQALANRIRALAADKGKQ